MAAYKLGAVRLLKACPLRRDPVAAAVAQHANEVGAALLRQAITGAHVGATAKGKRQGAGPLDARQANDWQAMIIMKNVQPGMQVQIEKIVIDIPAAPPIAEV